MVTGRHTPPPHTLMQLERELVLIEFPMVGHGHVDNRLKVVATHLKTKGSAVLQPLTTMMATVKLTQFYAVFCTIGWSSTLMAVSTPEAPVMVLLIIMLGRFCPEQE